MNTISDPLVDRAASADIEVSLRPERSLASLAISRLVKNRLAVLGLVILSALVLASTLAPVFTRYGPTAMDTSHRFQPPSADHLMGTDQFGRDLFSRIVYAGRVSLTVGIISVGLAGLLGTIIGLTSAYYGRWWDLVVSRVMDVLFAFPPVLLAIAIMAALGQNTTNVMIAIGIVNTPIFARLVRATAMGVSGRLFVEAAQALGASNRRIILRHIFPNCLPPLIVQTTVAFAWAVIAEAALSFLGLGTRPPTPSWGLILNEGRNVMEYAPWQPLFAGTAIMITVFSLNVLGDGLRDALDPEATR
ncbi:MAG: ABC transporter permease subunit [Anaerolineae bacterium]|nr:ABC transporter permease subunit [Anaerolineae bacterium]NIN99955.1 ABC transporter permease subunit [Anaerolineae bacterium]NIQ82713.1 ABC transporter permease subunit [Anaerolineae bacterium]